MVVLLALAWSRTEATIAFPSLAVRVLFLAFAGALAMAIAKAPAATLPPLNRDVAPAAAVGAFVMSDLIDAPALAGAAGALPALAAGLAGAFGSGLDGADDKIATVFLPFIAAACCLCWSLHLARSESASSFHRRLA